MSMNRPLCIRTERSLSSIFEEREKELQKARKEANKIIAEAEENANHYF